MEPGRLGGGSGTPFNDHCSTITVRPAQPRDAAAWLQLRRALWPEGSEAEHREDIDRFFAGDAREPLAVLLAEDGAGCPVGLAELSIRAYAEGCGSNRVVPRGMVRRAEGSSQRRRPGADRGGGGVGTFAGLQ